MNLNEIIIFISFVFLMFKIKEYLEYRYHESLMEGLDKLERKHKKMLDNNELE